jgi:hypothetical protein
MYIDILSSRDSGSDGSMKGWRRPAMRAVSIESLERF